MYLFEQEKARKPQNLQPGCLDVPGNGAYILKAPVKNEKSAFSRRISLKRENAMLFPKTPVSLRRLVLLCLAALALAGCLALHGLREKPSVSLSDIQLKQVGLLENAVVVWLRVMNPNDVSIDIKNITCNLSLNGKSFARGITANSSRVEPYSSVVVPVEIYISTLDTASALKRTLLLSIKGNATHYALEGTLTINVYGFTMNIPFSSTGEISMAKLSDSVKFWQ